MSWIGAQWSQVWPNLAANAIWVPLAWLHHRKVMSHLRRLTERKGQDDVKL